MSQDVSLCVIRLETSDKRSRSYGGKEASYRGPSSSLLSKFKGQRVVSEIRIETYTPEVCVPPIKPGMEEAGATALETNACASKIEEKVAKGAIHFSSGNPFVETSQGIIHLFKEDELTNIERAAKRSQTICILAVPATMTCSDLLSFIAACHDDIKHVRIIKDGSPNQYMALITFRSPISVVQFYESFNGIPFTSLEPEWCCHLVFVSKVEALGVEEGGSIAPFSHTELPTCPVCLERMDESVDGILTILCNHAFHGNCLAKWGDTSCPVCRYVQTPEPSGESRCLECSATESLWICLICGHVGCGRYLQAHAYQHYIDTHHCYSMQLGSNSVWDYVGDNFVHRILQNKADGKLVEGPNPDKPVEMKAKIDAIQQEYTSLLTTQLDSQRTYYEDIINMLEHKSVEEVSGWKEKALSSIAETRKNVDTIGSLKHEKINLEKKMQTLTNKLSTTQKQLDEEKSLNSCLQKNQSEWKEKFKTLEKDFNEFKLTKSKELNDVKEQLRDVMFYLEAEKTISSSTVKDELMGGTITVGPSTSGSSDKKHRKGKYRCN